MKILKFHYPVIQFLIIDNNTDVDLPENINKSTANLLIS